MFISRSKFKEYLTAFKFKELFLTLGWDNVKYDNTLDVNGVKFKLDGIVQKRGFIVISCISKNGFPDANTRKKIDKQISRLNFEHLLIYHDNAQKQIWQISIKEPNKPIQIREIEYHTNQEPELLYSKLKGFLFTLDEEDKIGLVDVKSRVTEQFNKNAEKVTKKFYTEFKKHHIAFQKFIEGLENQTDIDWYTSLMLNRLMFVYFIQKKGFLDGDTDYLSNKLKTVKEKKGKDKFYKSFYKTFLLTLFHQGLGKPNHTPELEEEIGKIPYLNGGLFDVHQLEKDNDKLNIKDEAFEKLFAFFNEYNWHLDIRPDATGKDINPDVIGYIFEKYINDRAAMGAYYTKEDITEYISKNTIIPFLFDRVKEKVKNAFADESSLWKMLKENPDRYIYDAVKYGIKSSGHSELVSESQLLNTDNPNHPLWQDLPDEIKIGFKPNLESKTVNDKTKKHLWEIRKVWNKKAPENIALPTETYRELIERRKRYAEIRRKIENDEIKDINDFITYNLNIRQFAQDAVEQYEGSDFINAFYNAIKEITILDPTCGSGAFLFAALNILEPLYEASILRMREFVEIDNEKGTGKKHENFRRVLTDIENHTNEKYYIYKSIILNNLYGVDIMNEAVEIAKLRLFLKLVAVVEPDDNDKNYGLEPLPDIDFNIRAGNTLVGFASYKEVENAIDEKEAGGSFVFGDERKAKQKVDDDANIVADLYKEFKDQQTINDPNSIAYKNTKEEVLERLNKLNVSLNKLLAHQYNVDENDKEKYEQWLTSHKPFHWFAEFYEIVHQHGGFDVIIGNPPYVEYSKIEYSLNNYNTIKCGNLYAFVMERLLTIKQKNSMMSMIVPLSGHSTDRMKPLVSSFYNNSTRLYLTNYSGDAHPSRLFDGVKFRLSIFVISFSDVEKQHFTSKYLKWYSDERERLFSLIYYSKSNFLINDAIAKLPSEKFETIHNKISQNKDTLLSYGGSEKIYFHNTPVNWIRSHNFIPYFKSERDGEKTSTQLKSLSFENTDISISAAGILASSIFFLTWIVSSDCYHLNNREIFSFKLSLRRDISALVKYSQALMKDLIKKAKRRLYEYKTSGLVEYDEFYLKLSKNIIDEIDTVLAEYYGFTEEELDFIINYDIKYRMGKELDAYINK